MHNDRLNHFNDLVTEILTAQGYDPRESVVVVDKDPVYIKQMPCHDKHFVFRWGRCENGRLIRLFFERIDPDTAQGERVYERRPGEWKRITNEGTAFKGPTEKTISFWAEDIIDFDRPRPPPTVLPTHSFTINP